MVHALALEAANSAWNMAEAVKSDIDLVEGTIVWWFLDKAANASAELLGTWNPADETFLWGWEHPSAPENLRNASVAVKDFADRHDIDELADALRPCTFDEGWALAAIAVLIGDLKGMCRVEAVRGGAWAYVGFGDVTVRSLA